MLEPTPPAAAAAADDESATNGGVDSVKSKKPFARLPITIVPKDYDLWLKPDLVSHTFTGRVSIALNVLEPTSAVVCNAAELVVGDVELAVDGGDKLKPAETNVAVDEETLSLRFEKPLPAGPAMLRIDFTGTLNDNMRGFYRSKYTQDGEERYCAVTQFESTDARRCFPCWDEPAIKATFSITIVAPKNRTVHSNMPESSETEDAENPTDLKVVKFEKSPIMSTYLVAIVVGEFEAVEGVSAEGTKVRVFTPKGKTEQGVFAKDTSIRALTFYKDFFSVSYPLPKYDCIAIADFQCGAMENWGLVTYRESAVLVDPENTSAASKQWIAIVVTHEMAHQWFGNLVTMEWWTHLWLNEGFASFCENTCTHALFPEFDIWTQFVADTLIAALELDAMANSHPIEVPVGHPSEVDEIFDNISYNKGASVIRMLHAYIGDAAFRSGMSAYLQNHSYANAETEDLWAALEKSSGKPVGQIMSTWTSQMGFPVINVQSRADGADTVLTLSQEKFSADGKDAPGYFWRVPVSILTSSGETTSVLLESETAEVRLKGFGGGDGGWFKLNPGFVGYYRVRYGSDDMQRFVPAIRSKQLAEVDRLNLLDDAFAMAKAGKAPTVDALRLLRAFADEDSYVVWSSINNWLSKLRMVIADTPEVHVNKMADVEERFKRFVVDLMSNITATVGWQAEAGGEPHVRGLLRSLCISRMGQFGHEATRAEANTRFRAHTATGPDNHTPLPADLRGPVYRTVMSTADQNTFDNMLKLFRSNDLHEEKDRLARSLGAAKNPDILRQALEFARSADVRAQDAPFVIGSVAANPLGREMAWKFFMEHFDEFKQQYKTGSLMMRLCRSCTEYFVSLEKAEEIESFFSTHGNPAERTIKQGLESIRLNAAWIERDSAAIRAFFADEV